MTNHSQTGFELLELAKKYAQLKTEFLTGPFKDLQSNPHIKKKDQSTLLTKIAEIEELEREIQQKNIIISNTIETCIPSTVSVWGCNLNSNCKMNRETKYRTTNDFTGGLKLEIYNAKSINLKTKIQAISQYKNHYSISVHPFRIGWELGQNGEHLDTRIEIYYKDELIPKEQYENCVFDTNIKYQIIPNFQNITSLEPTSSLAKHPEGIKRENFSELMKCPYDILYEIGTHLTTLIQNTPLPPEEDRKK